MSSSAPSSDLAFSVAAASPLETERLRFRPLVPNDAPDVARLAGRREIADTTISIPHPLSEEMAFDWIAGRTGRSGPGDELAFAVVLKDGGRLIGTIGLRHIDRGHAHAELGFWIGVDWWGRGYATEAARAIVRFALEELGLERVCAHHMVRNPASGRVLEKIGMRREGLLRHAVKKWGNFEDVVLLAMLRADLPQQARSVLRS